MLIAGGSSSSTSDARDPGGRGVTGAKGARWPRPSGGDRQIWSSTCLFADIALTAVGWSDDIAMPGGAIFVAIGVMIRFANVIGESRAHPTIRCCARFPLLIGMALIAEGLDSIPKGSLLRWRRVFVELLNIGMRNARRPGALTNVSRAVPSCPACGSRAIAGMMSPARYGRRPTLKGAAARRSIR